MKLTEVAAPDFDLAMTLDSGQVFHWEKIDHGFCGTIGDRPVYAEQCGDSLRATNGCADLVRNYFALDHPLAKICASFPNDALMQAARDFCRGLRIIRQPRWECLATFITSSMKQVAHIRQISLKLRQRFGKPVSAFGGVELFAYPEPLALARAGEAALLECGLGYRAKFLHQCAVRIADGSFDVKAVAALDDEA